MTDKELLELAAKAGCYEIEWCDTFPCGGCYMKTVTPEPPYPLSKQLPWNPLQDDGDALRLAVKLGMEVYIDNHPKGCDCVEVESITHREGRVILNLEDDPCAATRRAITRAAAEIGKQMREE